MITTLNSAEVNLQQKELFSLVITSSLRSASVASAAVHFLAAQSVAMCRGVVQGRIVMFSPLQTLPSVPIVCAAAVLGEKVITG